MTEFMKTNRNTVELIKALKNNKKVEDSTTNLFPIHNVLPNKGAKASGTIILFKKHGVKLRAQSKVQMFADQGMSKLLWQTEGTESMWDEFNGIRKTE
jgi:hypothetical protein